MNRLQQIKQKWRESTRIKEAAVRLSPECRDMLDKVFELNEKRRCSVEDIKSHPWFNMQMPPKYEAGIKRLEQQQQKIRRAAMQCNFKVTRMMVVGGWREANICFCERFFCLNSIKLCLMRPGAFWQLWVCSSPSL